MCKTNLRLMGKDMWGNIVSWPIYSEKKGLCVAVRKRNGIRRTLVPYRSFAKANMRHFYVIERG